MIRQERKMFKGAGTNVVNETDRDGEETNEGMHKCDWMRREKRGGGVR
jgi:hypothetical protein